MTVEEAIRHRRSIRRFTPDPVSSAEVRDMLALASRAPNIGNRQVWRFIVVTNPDLRRMLTGLIDRRLTEMREWPEFADNPQRLRPWFDSMRVFADAPVLIFLIKQHYHCRISDVLIRRGRKHWEVEGLFGRPDVQSAGAVAAYLTLLAEARGYGTCWMTDPLVAQQDLQAALTLAPDEEVAAALALGRPGEYPPPRPRRAIDEIIEWR